MNTVQLKDRIDLFRQSELPRLRRLASYFAGNHPILADSKDPGKPDNRLVNNFCRAITDSTVGYFMGIPVTYFAGDPISLAEIIRICRQNDEPFVNSALAGNLSVYGSAAEILWCDDGGSVRFAPLSPETVFPITSDDVTGSVIGAVRTFRNSKGDTAVQYLDSEGILDYTEKNGNLELVGEKEHFFGDVPVNFYQNNRDNTGDFEPVLTLVDAYNRLQSDSVNDFELFSDSYLAISGMGGTTTEDLEKLRRDRVLLLDDGGEARWLTKSVNDSYIENLKCRIAKDIYRFSGTADIAEIDSGGLASGVALKYRMINFENRVSVTEQFFRRGLMRRFRTIASLYSAMGRELDLSGFTVNFTRNLPGNVDAAADLAVKLKGIVSRETILGLLPFVDSPEAEIARMAKEGGDV